MNSNEEKAYYSWLEKVIRDRKRGMPMFNKDSDSYEMDIAMLMRHIEKVNPYLADKIIGNLIDTTDIKEASRADILAYMGRTEKGTIVKWRNENNEWKCQ